MTTAWSAGKMVTFHYSNHHDWNHLTWCVLLTAFISEQSTKDEPALDEEFVDESVAVGDADDDDDDDTLWLLLMLLPLWLWLWLWPWLFFTFQPTKLLLLLFDGIVTKLSTILTFVWCFVYCYHMNCLFFGEVLTDSLVYRCYGWWVLGHHDCRFLTLCRSCLSVLIVIRKCRFDCIQSCYFFPVVFIFIFFIIL